VTSLDLVADAVAAIAAGRPVLVVDNENRENEGDIIFAAQFATPALMGWTIRYSSGVVCVPMSGARADALALPPMVELNQDAKNTAYTVSCDAATGVSTGISAGDRARTAAVLAAPGSRPSDLTHHFGNYAYWGEPCELEEVHGGFRVARPLAHSSVYCAQRQYMPRPNQIGGAGHRVCEGP
jgi:hypothetical protein